MCVVKLGLGWAHDVFKFAYHMLMHFHSYIPSFIFILILILLVLFCVFLFLPPSFVSCFLAPKQKSTPSQNPFLSGASSSSDTTPSHVQFCNDKARKDFWRTFLNEAFIRNAKSFYQTFSILTFLLSSMSGLRVTVWHPSHLSLRDHSGVLLQHARIWYFSISFFRSHSRYTHCSYSGYCIWGTTCS